MAHVWPSLKTSLTQLLLPVALAVMLGLKLESKLNTKFFINNDIVLKGKSPQSGNERCSTYVYCMIVPIFSIRHLLWFISQKHSFNFLDYLDSGLFRLSLRVRTSLPLAMKFWLYWIVSQSFLTLFASSGQAVVVLPACTGNGSTAAGRGGSGGASDGSACCVVFCLNLSYRSYRINTLLRSSFTLRSKPEEKEILMWNMSGKNRGRRDL